MDLKSNHIDWWRFDSAFYPYLDKIDTIFRQFCFERYGTRLEPMMTSGRGGSHMTGSLHYTGRACDIRLLTHKHYQEIIPEATDGCNHALWKRFNERLGKDIDVVLEGTHFHIELDPKESSCPS